MELEQLLVVVVGDLWQEGTGQILSLKDSAVFFGEQLLLRCLWLFGLNSCILGDCLRKRVDKEVNVLADQA
jgi:hypothetical protein